MTPVTTKTPTVGPVTGSCGLPAWTGGAPGSVLVLALALGEIEVLGLVLALADALALVLAEADALVLALAEVDALAEADPLGAMLLGAQRRWHGVP